ncbi:MAG: Flp pilus assembly complex ATPase component TadA [Candidatus Omnitrophica bacterium]|nr:Flp pilus assembly complex ATPase component TadA [Candidatus Omnitrophota bacterium]
MGVPSIEKEILTRKGEIPKREQSHLMGIPLKTKSLLGQLLLEKQLITQEQLEIALKNQKETGKLLGAVLLELNFIAEESTFLPVLSGQLDVDYVYLKSMSIPPEVTSLIPAQFVTHYKVIPIGLKDEILTVAASSPLDIHVLDEISLVVTHRLKFVLGGERDILEAIRTYYGVGAETIEQMMDKVGPVSSTNDEVANIEEIESEASISKFFNQILLEAYKDCATDIHIEPFADELRVRYRIDGVMYDAKVPKNIRHFQDAISSRIKILSNLDIAEKRLPQDGRFKVRVGSIDLDMRVSFLPTPCGESIVLRILNTTKLYSLQELGLSDRERDILERLTEKPNGIIFLTGPTGSGKTTTLYACLSRMNTDAHKIITIEDPIEYQLKGITQIQINPGIGLTFAQGLRSMLRHDPDIMMVGEVRDMETATTAIQVALTGHLIFSTLHTNDAASGVARLLDMGVEAYLITSAIQCLIAQRLVRRVCCQCRKAVRLTLEMIREFGEQVPFEAGEVIYEHKGCDACHQTGYSGREAIYEFLIFSDDIQKLILERATAGEIKAKAVASGMKTLRQSGWEKVKQEITTFQEVARVTQDGT